MLRFFRRAPLSRRGSVRSLAIDYRPRPNANSLNLADRQEIAEAVAFQCNGRKFYGPYVHRINKGGWKKIIMSQHLKINHGSGSGGRADGVYAHAPINGKELEEKIKEKLNLSSSQKLQNETLFFFTTIQPHVLLYATWAEDRLQNEFEKLQMKDSVSDGLSIIAAFSIDKNGKIIIHDKDFAQKITDMLPLDSKCREYLQEEINQQVALAESKKEEVTVPRPGYS